MPQILINERDFTSSGTPNSYANYSVLIAGYMGRQPVLEDEYENGKLKTKADSVLPDSNGVYEFTSKQDFIDVIGLSEEEANSGIAITSTDSSSEVHYGRRMALALLNLGYTVIYRPIKSVLEENGITSEAFWDVFKDKANYDFRFISHGLLESSYDETEYQKLVSIQALAEANAEEFKNLMQTVEAAEGFADLGDTEKLIAYQTAYAQYLGTSENAIKKADGSLWFTDSTGALQYGTFSEAQEQFAVNALGKVPAVESAAQNLKNYEASNIMTGTINTVNGHIANLAGYFDSDANEVPGRGDCVALIELDEKEYVKSNTSSKPEQLIKEGIKGMSSSLAGKGAFCALTVPSVYCNISKTPVKFPGAFHYLACFMNSLKSGFAEWYAAAGYTRGVSTYPIVSTSVKLGEIAINALEPRSGDADTFACNVIANFRGSYYLWGNRTAAPLGANLTAKHFLNIRQLCSTIKKQLYVACRRFTFDPNSDTLWYNFVGAIRPTLEAMKADQGIRDYKIMKVPTDTKAALKAKIRIIPIEAVEDFDLEISLEDSFGETALNATESL